MSRCMGHCRAMSSLVPHSMSTRLKEDQWVYAIECNSRFYGSTHMLNSIPMSSVVAFQKQDVEERMLHDLRYITNYQHGRLPSYSIDIATSLHENHVNAPIPEGATLELYPAMIGILSGYLRANCINLDVITGDPDIQGSCKIISYPHSPDRRTCVSHLEKMLKVVR